MGTNFPGSLNSLNFTAFSDAMGNWRGNPCISHIIKYTIGCKSNGKRTSILWEKYEYQFPRFSTYHGFYKIFLRANLPRFSHSMGFSVFCHAMRNWWEKPCISHMMKHTKGWKSNGIPLFMEKVLDPISQAFPIQWVLLTFLMLWEILWEKPCISQVMKYTIRWESNGKKPPILWGKCEYQFLRFSTYDGFCRILPGINFPGFHNSIGLAVFSHVMGNWWENTWISHVMKYTIKWESNGKKAPILWEKYGYKFLKFSP